VSNIDLKELIIASLLTYDGFTLENWKEKWGELKKDAESKGHCGDCVNMAITCPKCYVGEIENVVSKVMSFFGLNHKTTGDEQ